MTSIDKKQINRRMFLKRSSALALATGLSGKPNMALGNNRANSNTQKKVIVIGFDGLDPHLAERMMDAGELPNFAALRRNGGYRRLGTSIPPQSPVAWANFINGTGPASHGIFDFIHRNPEQQVAPYFSAAEMVPGAGYWEVGDHKLQLNFWPFGHKPPMTLLRRQGVPFWDYLDAAGIDSVFYDLPSNYPPSSSQRGHHRCLSGMGTPDLMGTYGTYQHFAEEGPVRTISADGGMRSMIVFENETARAKLTGPTNRFLKKSQPTTIDFFIHRDREAQAVVIEIQGRKIILQKGQWSRWHTLDFTVSMPSFVPDKTLSAICRIYLQEVSPNFRLYITPLNSNPSDPAITISEPPGFIKEISHTLGLFYTTGFQEDHKALSNGIFTEDEFAAQTEIVLEERLALLEYALENYTRGLLFFYFSSTDMQSHMFWWDTDDQHPTRSGPKAKKYFRHLKDIYRRMDCVMGDITKRYGNEATIIAMSDHGFANFQRQFNLNTWLRDNGYISPADCTTILPKGQRDEVKVDWSTTKAYGLGINALYINLKGRERQGIVEPGQEREELINELIEKLEAVRDTKGERVIRRVHRTDKVYSGLVPTWAPDLIVGYSRGYRASWATCLGDITKDVVLDNNSAWSADHCADASEVPGVLFSNKSISSLSSNLTDLAPSILSEFGLETPATMTGKNIFAK